MELEQTRTLSALDVAAKAIKRMSVRKSGERRSEKRRATMKMVGRTSRGSHDDRIFRSTKSM